MNNRKFYPFERNYYYSGKVLSAGNLESEQRYVNDKHRMTNRFVAGSGILCGLDVVAVDAETVSLESGIALDGWGRELVAATPNVKKLSSLPGYESGKEDTDYWLYMGYEEKTDAGREWMKEQYQLYLTGQAPAYDSQIPEFCYRHREMIFENPALKIELIVPKFLQASKGFFLEVRVTPFLEQEVIRMKLKIHLECVRCRGKDTLEILFDSRKVRKTEGTYHLSYLCNALNIVEDLAVFSIGTEDFSLEWNDFSYEGEKTFCIQSVLSDFPVEKNVLEEYQTCLMNVLENSKTADVCIARIKVRQGKIQMIEKPEYGSRVWSNDCLALENQILKEKLQILELLPEEKKEEKQFARSQESITTASGDIVISLGIGGDAGKRFFSEEITHGLGLGNVSILLGMKENSSKDGCFVYGSSEIFDRDNPVKAELAARVNPAKGTFVIGVRLLESTSEYEVVVHWTAIMNRDSYLAGEERKIMIDNTLKSLRVMESTYYNVKFINMEPVELHWSVEEQGGTINDNGYYTAPDRPGVYKIKVAPQGEPELFSTAYVVVKP
jgi:hypothetical protein